MGLVLRRSRACDKRFPAAVAGEDALSVNRQAGKPTNAGLRSNYKNLESGNHGPPLNEPASGAPKFRYFGLRAYGAGITAPAA